MKGIVLAGAVIALLGLLALGGTLTLRLVQKRVLEENT